MLMPSIVDHDSLLSEAARVVCATVARGSVEPSGVPPLIRTVFIALRDSVVDAEAATSRRPEPAVPIKRSVRPDHLVCLEDGRRLKMLKRHLRVVYGMTPAEYRARWGLPPDYPMTAPEASAARSERARRIRARAHATGFAAALAAEAA